MSTARRTRNKTGPAALERHLHSDIQPHWKSVDIALTGSRLADVACRISHTSFDARNAYEQSLFWSKVLDWTEDPDDPNLPEHEECLIMSRDRNQLLLFITVPDDKVVKNRIHLDLRPSSGTREDEVARLVDHGAVQLADFRRSDGGGWITLADPEGNEFCVLATSPARSGPTT